MNGESYSEVVGGPAEAACPACGQPVERLKERLVGMIAATQQQVFAASPCGHPLVKAEAERIKSTWLSPRVDTIFGKVKK